MKIFPAGLPGMSQKFLVIMDDNQGMYKYFTPTAGNKQEAARVVCEENAGMDLVEVQYMH